MTSQDLMEFIDAAQQTNAVNHPLPNRGGIFLVGPPEAFKTSVIDKALQPYPDALVISDLNVQQLIRLKADLARSRYTTLAFREFSKLYERDPRTASSLIGHIRALADEGFKAASFEDPRMGATAARCMVIGAMTESFFKRQFNRWEEDGFLRRFIWLLYQVVNVQKATNAILNKETVKLDGIPRRYAGFKEIPFHMTKEDKELVVSLMKDQRGQTTPILLLSKILCVLKWKYKEEPKRPYQIMQAVQPALSKDGGVLVL